MAYTFYTAIKGKKQGQFKSNSKQEKRKDKWIEGLSYFHEVKSPRDIATGQASGKRQHLSITFAAEWGPQTPQILQALCTNEVLPEVEFNFVKTNENGEEYVYHKIKLTDATVSNAKYSTGSAAGEGASTSKHTGQHDTHELETISLSYRKIEMENIDGKTMMLDDWHIGGAG